MPLLGLAGGSAKIGRARAGTGGGGGTGYLASVPEGWSLVAEWNNPANLSPSSPLSFSGDSGQHSSTIVTSGYGTAPPNAPADNRVVSRAITGTGAPGGDFGNLGIDLSPALDAVCFVHVWKWPGTDGTDGYPYSWVNGGNKQAFLTNGGDRVYSVCRAQVPFDTYDAGENYRQPQLALWDSDSVTRPDGDSDEAYLLDLDTWITLTAVVDLRPSQGSRIARLYMQKGTDTPVTIGERTDLTTPVGTFTAAYVNNTNNGRTSGNYPFTGTMYDAYFGVFAP